MSEDIEDYPIGYNKIDPRLERTPGRRVPQNVINDMLRNAIDEGIRKKEGGENNGGNKSNETTE